MITANEAQSLFDGVRGLVREGEKFIIDIIERRAWEPLGYPSLAAAWDQEVGSDVILMTKAAKQAVLHEVVRSGDLGSLPRFKGIGSWRIARIAEQAKAGVPSEKIDLQGDYWGEELLEIFSGDSRPDGWSDWFWTEAKELYAEGKSPNGKKIKWISGRAPEGAPVPKGKKVHRRATEAALPSAPTTFHVYVGEAEYDRINRVMHAAGRFPSDLGKALSEYADRLEADLRVSV